MLTNSRCTVQYMSCKSQSSNCLFISSKGTKIRLCNSHDFQFLQIEDFFANVFLQAELLYKSQVTQLEK